MITDKNIIIKDGLTQDDFVKSDIFKDVINYKNHEYTQYYVNPQIIYGKRFTILLIFNPKGLIEFVKLALLTKNELPDWNNWSESKELERKKLHDEWLKLMIGIPPYEYNWGYISSNYDPRSGSSMITIRYKY